jgi:hypothetical protein
MAYGSPTGIGITGVDAARGEYDQIDALLQRVAHNFRGSIAVDDLFPPQNLSCFKGST